MYITIKYFGQIAEVTQKNEEQLDGVEGNVLKLLNMLNLKYPDLKNKTFQVAQNQELVTLDTELTGSEIALLPPFAGG